MEKFEEDINDIKIQLGGIISRLDHELKNMSLRIETIEKWIENKDKNFYGTFNYVYRAIIFIILTYVAYRLGLKP